MNVIGVSWVGVRTDHYEELVAFFQRLLGMDVVHESHQCTGLGLAGGAKVEVFGPQSPYNMYFDTGPVVGFLVDDVREATEELRRAGIEIVSEPGENYWAHFRGPDGRIYEINDNPRPRDAP